MNAVVARVLAGVTVAAAAGVLVGPSAVAVPGGLLLGLVLPGLAVTATLFRGRALTAVERTVLAPAVSLAVLVIGGLAINVSGFALDRTAWTAVTAGIALLALIGPAVPLPRRGPQRASAAAAKEAEIATLALAAKAAVQASSREVGEQRVRIIPPPPVDGRGFVPRRDKPPLKRIGRQLLPMVLVLAVLGAASWLSYVSSRNSYHTTVTALSAAPPGAPNAAGHRTVTVTASGLVAADGPYRVTVVERGGAVTSRRTVPVLGSGTWTAGLSVGRVRTTISLYRASDATAYRTLTVAATG